MHIGEVVCYFITTYAGRTHSPRGAFYDPIGHSNVFVTYGVEIRLGTLQFIILSLLMPEDSFHQGASYDQMRQLSNTTSF